MKPEHEYKQTFNPWCECGTCKSTAKYLHEKHLGRDAKIRAERDALQKHSDNQHAIHQSVTGQMQDEIDRLTAQVETLTRDLAEAWAIINTLRKRNAELAEALQDTIESGTECGCQCCNVEAKRARAALAGGK
jgi:uncharacterized protein YoxC